MSSESSSYHYNDRRNDNDESNSTKKKNSNDFDKNRKSKNSADISDEDNQKSKSTDQNNDYRNKSKSPVSNKQPPVKDLLGDDINFTPYVQASQDDEFGQFHEATSPTSSVQPSLWPTSTQSSSFDPFAAFETSNNLVQPTDSSTNKTSSNGFDLFMAQTQPAMFSANQQQQSFTHPSTFQQQPMMQPPIQQQSNTNSFNNTWSFAQGKVDISLNNLIPYTRGDPHKNSLPLNQLTSPTNPGNAQSIFPTSNKK